MKVTGFTFIRNAIIYDYPIVEAITSILPICDEFVVAVGKSDDETLSLIQEIGTDKIRILETEWDDSLREGGKVLADETNKAFQAIDEETDWCFYLQGDEVVHEQYLAEIKAAMETWKDNDRVDGLLFNYQHFYGSYDYVGSSPKWYSKEIRVVKNDKSIYSFRDAQGFKKGNNVCLNVKPLDAFIYHYGWVKPPQKMQKKQLNFNKYWHDDDWVEKHVAKGDEFDYSNIDALQKFVGTHPKVMEERIKKSNWKFDYDISTNKLDFKNKVKLVLRSLFNLDFGYKNYKKV